MNDTEAYEKAKSLFSYEPNTGVLLRIAPTLRRDGFFSKKGVGHHAGWIDANGYRQVQLAGKVFYAHRIAWLLQTGSWPKQQIDHINGIRSDNRWCNLRDVSKSRNMENQHKKRGKDHNLPIGVSSYFYGESLRYAVRLKRNGLLLQSTRSSLDEALSLLESFKQKLA